MRRDMDLIRLIMLEIEKSNEDEVENIKIPDYNDETIKNHCQLLRDNNFVESYKTDILDNYYVGQLTWEGYDYLDKVRDNSVWKKTKDTITQKGLPLVFDTIKAVANSFITAAAEGVVNSIIKNGGQG